MLKDLSGGRVYFVHVTGPLQSWHHGKVLDIKKRQKWNWKNSHGALFMPDSEDSGRMISENHFRQILDTQRWSLALPEEVSEGRKQY